MFLLSLLFVLFVLDLSFSFSSVGASTRLKRASPKRRTQIFKLKYKITSYCARCFSPILCQRNAFHVFYEDLWRCVWVLLRTLHDACEFWCGPLTFCWGPLTMRWIFAQDLSRFAEDLWRCQWLLLRTFWRCVWVLLRTFHDACEFCLRPLTMRVSFAEDLWRCVWVLLKTFHDACEFCWGPLTMRVSFTEDLRWCVWVLLRTFDDACALYWKKWWCVWVLLRTFDDACEFCWGPFSSCC